jgi:hypothetical protein
VLSNARSEIVLSLVSTDADDAINAVSSFPLLEQDVDPIIWHSGHIFSPEPRQA